MPSRGDRGSAGPGEARKDAEPDWLSAPLFLNDRGAETFKPHLDVAREARVSRQWLEERMREESIVGFETDDGSWVTTLRSVWKYLEREPLDSPCETVHGWDELERLTPAPFVIRPRVSRAGNCVFMYFAPDEAWADRVDDFLTVYRAFEKTRVVGFKLKNLSLLTARLGDVWVEFQTAEFEIHLLVRRVLQASLSSPTFDHDALSKYQEVFETAQTLMAPPIPALV